MSVAKRSTKSHRRRASFRPTCESLESRRLMCVDLAATLPVAHDSDPSDDGVAEVAVQANEQAGIDEPIVDPGSAGRQDSLSKESEKPDGQNANGRANQQRPAEQSPGTSDLPADFELGCGTAVLDTFEHFLAICDMYRTTKSPEEILQYWLRQTESEGPKPDEILQRWLNDSESEGPRPSERAPGQDDKEPVGEGSDMETETGENQEQAHNTDMPLNPGTVDVLMGSGQLNQVFNGGQPNLRPPAQVAAAGRSSTLVAQGDNFVTVQFPDGSKGTYWLNGTPSLTQQGNKQTAAWPNGTRYEDHDGIRIWSFPDGKQATLNPTTIREDGNTVTTYPNGERHILSPNGDMVIVRANGTRDVAR